MMKTLSVLLIAILLVSCNNGKTSDSIASNKSTAHILTVEIDGKEHHFKTIDWQRSTIDYKEDKIYIQLEEEGNQILFTLEVQGINTQENHSGSYELPNDQATEKKIYLSFLDKKRKTKALNRRIEFKEGEINIEHLSKDKLEMTFSGQGSGIMEHDLRFDIKGSANVNLQTNKN